VNMLIIVYLANLLGQQRAQRARAVAAGMSLNAPKVAKVVHRAVNKS
jgi:hypothetical protein